MRGLGRSSTFPFPQYIADDEHETVYFDEGLGRTLVLVHGLGANCTNWEPIVRILAPRCRLVGLDLVGCGWSRKPDVRYTVDLLRDHLLGFLERRGIGRATLIGHSMGGAVVIAAALAQPSLAEGLVLIDAAGVSRLPLWMRLGAGVALHRALLLPALGLGAGLILDNVFVDAPRENRNVRWFREASLRDGPLLPNLRDFARVSESLCRDIVRRDYSGELLRIDAPVLAIWGECDKLTTLGCGDRLEGLRRLRTVVLERCGHMPMVERPEETAFCIERFLDAPPGGTPDRDDARGTRSTLAPDSRTTGGAAQVWWPIRYRTMNSAAPSMTRSSSNSPSGLP